VASVRTFSKGRMTPQYTRMDPYKPFRYEQGIDAKIVVMGNTGSSFFNSPIIPSNSSPGVGKTSVLQRYTQNKFDPRNTTSTTGAFFVTKKVYVDGLKVRLQLWDTAGQERFRSMAPMYYRGANAALLLYDITNASTFDDIRGWLEELKKNCPTDLIIYIVGSKADLHHHRQVTSDLARLSLHKWFPPPRPPTPPPPPQPSTLSYIRPRFTSFTSLRSPPTSPTSPEPLAYLDPPPSISSTLKRNSSTIIPRPTAGTALHRSKTTTAAARSPPSFASHFGLKTGGWNDTAENSSNSLNEDDEDAVADEEEEWGLHKGMELFEVSAKDNIGIQNLFDSLISVIISRKDRIERENELKKRDSVFLSSVSTPTWSAQAEEEEAREKAARSGSWNSCC
jgi:small GTP-binding protein